MKSIAVVAATANMIKATNTKAKNLSISILVDKLEP